MVHIIHKIEGILLSKVYRFKSMIKSKIFKKKHLLPKMVQNLTFLAFSKVQKLTLKVLKDLKQKRCVMKHLNVPNFCYFKNDQDFMVKKAKFSKRKKILHSLLYFHSKT
jgi:hypothetical protein